MSLRICIIALNAYPVVDPRAHGGFGGIETRSWTFAKGLARLPDVDVHYVVRHSEDLYQTNYSGVTLHLLKDPTYFIRESLGMRVRRLKRFPYLWVKNPKWSDLIWGPWILIRKLLRKLSPAESSSLFYQALPADVFLTFGVDGTAFDVIKSAHAVSKKCALFIGCDTDLDPRYLKDDAHQSMSHAKAHVCGESLLKADSILCQTPFQVNAARLFGRTAALIQNPIDLSDWDRLQQKGCADSLTGGLKKYVLWIGRADAVQKKPVEFVDLSRACPEISFLMVLNKRDDQVEHEVRSNAPDNLRIVEKVAFEDVPGLMRNAAVLVNTSAFEGFPNVFLQAAASRVPVASLHVEADFLAKTHMGACANGDLATLVQIVRRYWNQAFSLDELEAARRYVEDNHSLESQCEQLLEELKTLAP